LRLGSGRAGDAPPKAAMLDRAAAAGLAVAPGWVLVDIPAAGPGAHDLAGRLGLRWADGTLAVRSAFSGEDGDTTSGAGRFHTELGVSVDDVALVEAVARVWESGGTHAGDRAVLLMRMVAAQHAGVAFTESAHEDDLVNWTPGLGNALVSGATPGERIGLPKLRRFERTSPSGPPFAARLARLLRGVREVFGTGDWDVEWADDGTVCWLLQVRPITRAPRRDETFTIANHKEILPPLPSRFMASMIASCSSDLLDWFRQFDTDVPTSRPLIEVFRGRPMLNLSLLVDMTRVWGMPSRLVTDSLGGSAHLQAGLRPARLARAAPRLARMGIAQARAATATRRTEEAILARTADPGTDIGACIGST
jgi:rifampicin phosphotransferase